MTKGILWFPLVHAPFFIGSVLSIDDQAKEYVANRMLRIELARYYEPVFQ